jgi:hypothetical protein
MALAARDGVVSVHAEQLFGLRGLEIDAHDFY